MNIPIEKKSSDPCYPSTMIIWEPNQIIANGGIAKVVSFFGTKYEDVIFVDFNKVEGISISRDKGTRYLNFHLPLHVNPISVWLTDCHLSEMDTFSGSYYDDNIISDSELLDKVNLALKKYRAKKPKQ